MTQEDFFNDLLEQIKFTNDSSRTQSAQSLFSIYSEYLQSAGQLSEELVEIEFGTEGYFFSAFSRDTERRSLNIIMSDYRSSFNAAKFYKKDAEMFFTGFKYLFEKVIIPQKEDIDESNPLREFIDDLCSKSGFYDSFKIWLLSNGIYSSRDFPQLNGNVCGFETELHLIDLSSYQSMVTDIERQNIQIDCELDALKVIETPHYTSYLTSVTGSDLVLYYDQYGKRLLESNVRTFLSLRGNVNKGIYNTIRSDEKVFFFAYNNGLSATASEVNFKNGKIFSVSDLQIVNGGQTMSTIFKARKDGCDISDVAVQMKLSVIHDREKFMGYVSKISEYANTQNKVNKSDFFSNTYFHKRFKEISQIIRVPAKSGEVTTSKWFYERVKGEYLNDQMYMTETEKKKFLLEYPREQVIDKIIISKASLSWDLFPFEVSKGAQLCFAKFAQKVSDLYEEGDPDCNEFLFQKTISQVILFRSVQRLISDADWYSGGYRAQTVPYTISLFSLILRNEGKTIDWNMLWGQQNIESKLERYLFDIARKVHGSLINPPEGFQNIGTYCKMTECWERLKRLASSLNKPPLVKSIIDLVEEKAEKIKSKQKEKMNIGIDNQVKIHELTRTKTPQDLLEFYNSKYAPPVTDLQRSIMKGWYDGRISFPTEKQANVLVGLINKAIEAGFTGI